MEAFRRITMRAKRWRKPGRSCSTTTLLEENNNNDQQDAGHRYAPPKPPEPPEPHYGAEQQLLQNLLAKSSRMDPGDSNYEKQKLWVDQLIQAFVSQSFPDPPADPDGSLGEHLTHVMEAVVHKLETHGPVISREESRILMDHCHRHTFTHLNTLLQRVNAPRNTFLLMSWVSHTYLGQEMLDNPDQRLLHEWETKAKVKLLESVQIHVRGSLGKVLEVDRAQTHHGEEAYVGLYVDIIQCIGAMTKAAGDISSELHTQVWEVCLRELLVLVRRYTEEQTEALAEETNTWLGNRGNLETIRFLKTLKTCKELRLLSQVSLASHLLQAVAGEIGIRQHVQTGGKGLHTSLLKETVRTLENMEAFTLERLMEIVADIAERIIRNYFKSSKRELLNFTDLKTYFPRLSYVSDEQKRVMDEAYKLMAHTYLKHLTQNSQSRLKRWTCDLGLAVRCDAQLLHSAMSELAPGVQPRNGMLLKVPQLVACPSIDVLKLIVAEMEEECAKQSDDVKLLPSMLRWKGLPRGKVREVMAALPSSESSGSGGSCCTCRCS